MFKKISLFSFIFCLAFFSLAKAAPLEGGVSFDVNSARQYVQDGEFDNPDLSGPAYFEGEGKSTEKVVYSYNNNGDVVGINVQYINEPKKAYIYNKNKQLISVDVYDKPINVYPHRGYRYSLDGKLILTSLTVSKNELFRFDPNGKLIAHSVKGIIYDENGRVIGRGK